MGQSREGFTDSFLRTFKIIKCEGHLSLDDTRERIVIGPVIIVQGSRNKIGSLDTGFIL
jgi:hypothetical protein